MSESISKLMTAQSMEMMRNTIKHAINKYDNSWIVIHEAVQNSIDAIDENPDIDSGNIKITFDLDLNQVKIQDNGIGFPHDPKYFIPNLGTKSQQRHTKGYAGIGLKAVVFSSMYFQVESIRSERKWGITIEKATDFLNGIDINYELAQDTDEIKSGKPNGTICQYKFPESSNGEVIEEFFCEIYEEYMASYLDDEFALKENSNLPPYILLSKKERQLRLLFERAVELHFRRNSYAACIDRLLGVKYPDDKLLQKPIQIGLTLNQPQKQGTMPLIKKIFQQSGDRVLSFEFPVKLWSLKEAILRGSEDLTPAAMRKARLPHLVDGAIDGSQLGDPGLRQNSMYELCVMIDPDLSDEEARYAPLRALLGVRPDRDMTRGVKELLPILEKRLFPHVLGIYVGIGNTELNERFSGSRHGRQRIFARGNPTAHDLSFSSTSSTWYNAVIDFAIDVNAPCEDGKKHLINTHLIKACKDFYRLAYNTTLENMAQKFLKATRGGRRQEDLPNLAELPSIEISDVSVVREPLDENTLIALFYQILALKKWKLPTFGLSQSAIYDGYFAYPTEVDTVKSTNDLHRLEFKMRVSDLIDEFESPESNTKQYNETDLAVVWIADIPQNRQHWQITGIPPSLERNLQERECKITISSVLFDNSVSGHDGVPIIILKDLIDELQD